MSLVPAICLVAIVVFLFMAVASEIQDYIAHRVYVARAGLWLDCVVRREGRIG